MTRPRRLRSVLRAGAAVALVFASAAVLAGSAGAKDDRPGTPRVDATTILVKFRSNAAATAGLRAVGDRSAGVVPGGVQVVRLAGGRSVGERLAAYRQLRGVVYAEPNVVRAAALAAPDDPSYPSQWGLSAIRALDGWTTFPGTYEPGAGTRIAVLDSGVLSTHPDLAANVDTSAAATCTTGTCSASAALDDNGHGTHVAGIAAAVTNNGIGIAGVGLSSHIVPVKVLAANGFGSDASVASGIYWAVARGAKVINLSLGGPGFSQTLCNAVASANAAGALVVAAAGNSGSSTPFYPAACPGAIGVAATAADGSSPSWSNWGKPNTFISAPGASIYSTYRTSLGATYATLSGTSMAAPHVAGLAGLLLGQAPTRTPGQLKQILARSAEKIGAGLYPTLTYGTDPFGTCAGCTWHPYYGYGEVDAHAALCAGATATITGVSATTAGEGSAVTITGPNVGCATVVSLGLVPTTFTVVSSTQITAVVPAGVGYGYWRVTSGTGTAVSPLVFTVGSPNISSFSPTSGTTGSTVTITGTGLSDATSVTLGYVPASFTIDSPTQITATVPPGVSYGRWRVGNAAWTAAHPLVYSVAGTGELVASPNVAPVGSTVTLTGTGLASATAVSLGLVPTTFTVVSSTQITAVVPAGVGYGYWRVTSGTGTAVSPLVFTVGSPNISSFSPTSGTTGSTVTITGTGLSDATSVTLGYVPASFTIDSPTQITATVPPGVSYGRWRVGNAAWTAAHPLVYSVAG